MKHKKLSVVLSKFKRILPNCTPSVFRDHLAFVPSGDIIGLTAWSQGAFLAGNTCEAWLSSSLGAWGGSKMVNVDRIKHLFDGTHESRFVHAYPSPYKMTLCQIRPGGRMNKYQTHTAKHLKNISIKSKQKQMNYVISHGYFFSLCISGLLSGWGVFIRTSVRDPASRETTRKSLKAFFLNEKKKKKNGKKKKMKKKLVLSLAGKDVYKIFCDAVILEHIE